MDLGLKEKAILVTGASRGIGKAIAALFAAEGSTVVLTARNQQDLDQAAQEIQLRGGRTLAITADVTNAGQVQRLVQQTIAHVPRRPYLRKRRWESVRIEWSVSRLRA